MIDMDVCGDEEEGEEGDVMEEGDEYNEGNNVKLLYKDGNYSIRAINKGGYNSTRVDLIQVLKWLKENRPDILTKAGV